MLFLNNNTNNLYLKHVRQGWKTQVEIDVYKYYSVWCESYEVKTTILSFIDVWLKGFKLLTDHRRYVWFIKHVCDENNKIKNETQLLKWRYRKLR